MANKDGDRDRYGSERKDVTSPTAPTAPAAAPAPIPVAGDAPLTERQREGRATSTDDQSQRPVLNGEAKAEEDRTAAEARGTAPGTATTDQPDSPYVVADGKSITVKDGGMLSAGQPISERDLPEGQKRIDELVKAGIVTKRDGSQTDGDAPKP
jgi:hypothetical protein